MNKSEKKWAFNWKFALLIFGFMILMSADHLTVAGLIGYATGALFVGALIGFDRSIKI